MGGVPHDRLLRRVWNPGKPGNLRKLGDDASNPKRIFAEPASATGSPRGAKDPREG